MHSAGHPRLTAAQQYVNLRASPVARGNGRLHAGQLMWNFDTRPTAVSRSYTIRISYKQGDQPIADVLRPNLLELSGGRKIPHLYSQAPPRLCLYLPSAFEWTPSMRISETIVPWVNLWLFFFEEWLISNDWKGGGVHPPGLNAAN